MKLTAAELIILFFFVSTVSVWGKSTSASIPFAREINSAGLVDHAEVMRLVADQIVNEHRGGERKEVSESGKRPAQFEPAYLNGLIADDQFQPLSYGEWPDGIP